MEKITMDSNFQGIIPSITMNQTNVPKTCSKCGQTTLFNVECSACLAREAELVERNYLLKDIFQKIKQLDYLEHTIGYQCSNEELKNLKYLLGKYIKPSKREIEAKEKLNQRSNK
ncbi:MAG TPA: hypothetical protein VI911_10535 [Patescibacteria group bacterium]|nr:hypothetical protein [Patescibacteria group bacterium]